MNDPTQALLRRIERKLDKPVLPYWYPPPGAFFQDAIGQASVGIGGAFSTIYTFTVPPQRQCMITKLGLEPNDPAAAATVSFRMLINNTPHYNYQAPPVLLGTIDNPADVYVSIDQRQVFELQLADTAAVGHVIFYRLWYWTWDDQLFARPGGGDELAPEDV